jgi:hypothetical protein
MKGHNRLGYPYWYIRIHKKEYTTYKQPTIYCRACALVVMATPAMMIAAPAHVAS